MGTRDQDAFNGYLDTSRIINSSRFPTLLTIIVDDITPTSPTSPKSGRDPDEWRLSNADPRDPNRTKYKIHTLDVYLWVQEDATLVTEIFRKLLQPNQLDLPDPEPKPEPEPESAKSAEHPMSPVVQNLEHMAVSDPAYNGQNQDRNRQQAHSAVSPSSSFASHNLPPPPPPSGPGMHSPSPTISDMSQPVHQTTTETKPQSTNFAPLAYNPAAPAAPEPIAHREKTPPPEDGEGGTGLAHAMKHDHGYVPGPPQGSYQIGQGPPVTFGGGYASPPPQQPGYTSPPPPPPPPSTTAGYVSPPPPSNYSQNQDPRSSTVSNAPSFGPPPTQAQNQHDHRHSLAAETYVPAQPPQQPALTPGSQFYGSLSSSSGSKPLAHVQPQYPDYLSSGGPGAPAQVQPPPPGVQSFSGSPPQPLPLGGYSNYDYRAQPQSSSGNIYDVHQQVYRPTEAEAGAHGRKPSRVSSVHSGNMDSGSGGGRDRRESRADRVEKGVGRLFKKLEKKIG